MAGVAAAGAETMNAIYDTVGIGWRPELAAGILDHHARIDLVEVIADDFFGEPRRVRALKTLSAQVPIALHGVGLGLASASAVETWRIERMAHLVESISPLFWSEHLAFVRADGIEIGHLAAPPRSDATVDGAAENLLRASRIVGVKPSWKILRLSSNLREALLMRRPGSAKSFLLQIAICSWISTTSSPMV